MEVFLQYEIVIVNLDPTIGHEIKKTRLCVIVSPNEINKYLSTITICPISSQSKNYPTRVEFYLEGSLNWILVDQIRTIDKSRILKTVDVLDVASIKVLKSVIKKAFVD